MNQAELTPEAADYVELLLAWTEGTLADWVTHDQIMGVIEAAGYDAGEFLEHVKALESDDDSGTVAAAATDSAVRFRLEPTAEVTFTLTAPEIHGVPDFPR